MKKLTILGLCAGMLLLAISAYAGSQWADTNSVNAASTSTTLLFNPRGARTSYFISHSNSVKVYLATATQASTASLMEIPANIIFEDTGRDDVYTGAIYVLTGATGNTAPVTGLETWWDQ